MKMFYEEALTPQQKDDAVKLNKTIQYICGNLCVNTVYELYATLPVKWSDHYDPNFETDQRDIRRSDNSQASILLMNSEVLTRLFKQHNYEYKVPPDSYFLAFETPAGKTGIQTTEITPDEHLIFRSVNDDGSIDYDLIEGALRQEAKSRGETLDESLFDNLRETVPLTITEFFARAKSVGLDIRDFQKTMY